MNYILCLETSAAKCSVAIAKDGLTMSYHEIESGYAHVSQITILIQQSLDTLKLDFKDLQAVAISGGPGSYTGLRVASSAAKGLCFGLDIPLISISSLYLIAHVAKLNNKGHNDSSIYISVIDARRDEVYTAGYKSNLDQLFSDKSLILDTESFNNYVKEGLDVIIAGDAANKSSKLINNKSIKYNQATLDARSLAGPAFVEYKASTFENLNSYTPHYLKPPNITVSKKEIFRNI